MRDIFGIAVAVVIAGLSQIVQPWSLWWNVGMSVAALIAIASGGHLVWKAFPDRIKAHLGPATWSNGKVKGGRIRAAAGIGILFVILCGGYVASHWPYGFLHSAAENSAPKIEEPVVSRMNHFIMSCNVPSDAPSAPPESAPNDPFWALQDYKQKLDVVGDALGLAFTVEQIRGGVRIGVEAATEEAKQRGLPLTAVGVTHFTFEVRRLEKGLLVSIIIPMPPALAFYGLITPNPAAQSSIQIARWTEHFFNWPTGVCRLV